MSEFELEFLPELHDLTVEVHGKFDLTPVMKKEGSAAFDLHTPTDIYLPYNSRRMVDTGVIVKTPQPLFLLLVQRSSVGTKRAKSVRIANVVGIVDSNYRGQDDTIGVALEREDKKQDYMGELILDAPSTHRSPSHQAQSKFGVPAERLSLIQTGPETYDVFAMLNEDPADFKIFSAGDRFCQLVFVPCACPDLLVSALEKFDDPNRGGYGSTGE